MKATLVALDYQGLTVSFNEDGWFNATAVAAHYGKFPNDWLEQGETAEYIATLLDFQLPGQPVIEEIQQLINGKINRATHNRLLRLVKKTGLVKTRTGASETGGGTWLHPDLGVPFARWLDIRFAIWCDRQIRTLLMQQHPHFDWKLQRHEASASFKVMNDILAAVRTDQGKPTAAHHYINEARLVNWALAGEFKALDREALPIHELNLLAKLELKNATLIGRGVSYADRKKILESTTLEARVVSSPVLPSQQAA